MFGYLLVPRLLKLQKMAGEGYFRYYAMPLDSLVLSWHCGYPGSSICVLRVGDFISYRLLYVPITLTLEMVFR